MCQRPKRWTCCAAVDDLPVGEVGALLALDARPGRLARLSGRGSLSRSDSSSRQRQQPGIAPGGQQQVGVVCAQQGAQVDQQRAGRLQGQAAAVAPGGAPPAGGGVGVGGVAVRLQREDAQRRDGRVQVPGRVQHLELLDLPVAPRRRSGSAPAGRCRRRRRGAGPGAGRRRKRSGPGRPGQPAGRGAAGWRAAPPGPPGRSPGRG